MDKWSWHGAEEVINQQWWVSPCSDEEREAGVPTQRVPAGEEQGDPSGCGFRMWLHLCGLNVGGFGATRIVDQGSCTESLSIFCMTVDACSSPSSLSKVVQEKCVSNFLLCHTRGFELPSCF